MFGDDFTGPLKRQIRWGTYEKDNTLRGISVVDLLEPLKHLSCRVSANIEQDKIVRAGLPEKSRLGEVLDRMHLDSMTLEDVNAHLTRRLAAVDQKNSPVRKILKTTIGGLPEHGAPQGSSLLSKRRYGRIFPQEGARVNRNMKSPGGRGFFAFQDLALGAPLHSETQRRHRAAQRDGILLSNQIGSQKVR